MHLVDLHVHSTASDGTLTPAQVTALALETGLDAYALTDHDTTDGVEEALKAAESTPLTVVPGAELSSQWEGKEIHILGLFLDYKHPALTDTLRALRHRREMRNDTMLLQFQRDGFAIAKEDLTGGSENTVITRAHFARALLNRGYVTSTDQAFQKYLEQGKKYFIPKETLTPDQAISLIREAGGFPALAHPLQYKLGWERTKSLLADLTAMGLLGAEVYYSSHTQNDSTRLLELCRHFSLLPTGGSDFHGSNKPDIHLGKGRGGLRVSSLLLEDIRRKLESD